MLNHRRPSRQRPVGGFTLVELLVALALAGMVVAVSGEIAVTSLQVRDDAARIIGRMEREARVFESISADCASALNLPVGDDPPLAVFGTSQTVLQINAAASPPAFNLGLHLPKLPTTVRYRLVRSPLARDNENLVRETLDRTDAAAIPLGEVVATRVSSFQVETWSQGKWLSTYPPAGQPAPAPTLLRITCAWADGGVARWTVPWRGNR